MRKKVFHKVIPLAVAAGFFAGVPGMLPAEQGWGWKMPAVEAAAPVCWDFSKGLAGWKYGGQWAYPGEAAVAYAPLLGGALQIQADFSTQVNNSWSEIKLEEGTAAAKAVDMQGSTALVFQFYYNPQDMHTGMFKTKLYAKAPDGQEVLNVCADIDLSQARDAGNGLKVVPVKIVFPSVTDKISYLCLSLVGSNTDYKGRLYINQLRAVQESQADGYVEKTTTVQRKAKLQPDGLSIPAEVLLADGQASTATAQLYAYLQGIADSPYVLYGHQNEMHKKVSRLAGGSDTYDMVQDQAAVVGVDGLALTGAELSLTDAEKAAGQTLTDKLAGISIAASRQGSVLTMSCHMPNFAMVAGRPKIAGKYDYSGYSPDVTSGDVVRRILPQGDLNAVYTGYLDMIADYAAKLQAANVPLILRPFHENNGSWFWWGAAYCSPSQYKNLFRYTEEYLRDVKGLHNLLYAYSPGGPFTDAADYLTRYPGDAYVDILGFDMYHRDPVKDDTWMKSMEDTMDIVQSAAAQHKKLAAVTETGILSGKSAMTRTGNQRLDWFREVLEKISPRRMAYFMTWSNFDTSNFDQPYMVTARRGHEMINAFIDFYNQPQAVFAGQMADYTKLSVKGQSALQRTGYIVSPDSFTRICTPCHVAAKVAGAEGAAAFQLKAKDADTVVVVPARREPDGKCGADITAAVLHSLGKGLGSIALQLDGQPVDTVPVVFNLPAPAVNPAMVDDFESYYGDNGLLRAAYSTNCGAGCAVIPTLSLHAGEKQGESGLDFYYHINKGGYAGIVKSLQGADWSSYRALQFWLRPDGQGQKLIIQLNSNGEDFEVELTTLAAQKQPQFVVLPFERFKGKNGGYFDKSQVQHFAIYCNTIGNASIASHLYFDDIQVIK